MPALIALLMWLGVLIGAAPAGAHQADPNIDTAILRLTPNASGIEVSIVQGGLIPAMSAYNPTGGQLEVLGADGAAFLRLGPRGTEANLASASYWRSTAPSGAARVPPGAFSGAPARWQLISRRPAWAWYDQRVPAIQSAPASARSRSQPTLLARFAIPLRLGSTAVTASGVVEYLPPHASPAAYMTSSLHPAPGLTVALLAGPYPDVYLQNSSATPVTVLGQAGEPFAQVGPAGVRVNLRSPIYAADQLARGNQPGIKPDPAAPPVWRTVGSSRSFDWLDPRPRYLDLWTIPLRFGGRDVSITGGRRSAGLATPTPRPAAATPTPATGSGTPWWVFLLAGIALLSAAAIAWLLRRRR
jgi:LPXTG-motif cell wall-anchored protein